MESFYIKIFFTNYPFIPFIHFGRRQGNKISIITFLKNLPAASKLLSRELVEILNML